MRIMFHPVINCVFLCRDGVRRLLAERHLLCAQNNMDINYRPTDIKVSSCGKTTNNQNKVIIN